MKPYWVFDRWGNQIDAISNPIEARPTYLMDGPDTLELEIPGTGLSKGQRIVRMDRYGDWREYIVSQVEYRHEGGVQATVSCTDSIEELDTDYLVEVEPGEVAADRALERALSSSRWKVGTVTVTGTCNFSWYHASATEAVDEIVDAFNAEMRTSVTVKGTGVSERRIDLLEHRGADNGLLLTYGHNVTAVERVVSSDPVYTALYGYGKSQETDAGGHSRKLTFGSVNGGVDWTGDDEARERYGVPDGAGGKRHAFGKIEFSECEDAGELLSLTKQHLATVCKPTVSYTVTVAYLDPDRLPAIGDTAHVRDRDLDERLTTRVIKVEADDRDEGATRVTFGTTRKTLTARIKSTEKAAQEAQAGVEDMEGRSHNWDETSETVDTAPGEWLKKVMDRLNEEFDAAKTYKFSSFERGDIWANGPLTADGKPTGGTDSAINLNGLGLRISSKVQGGDFVWTTFGTGEGFTANLINVGTLRCGDNFLNLDTGEMRIAANSATVSGGQTLDRWVSDEASDVASDVVDGALVDYVPKDGFDSFLDLDNVFNALTRNGQDKGLFIGSDGAVAINADIIKSGIIASRNNQSFFNLDQGYLEATGNIYAVGQYHTMRSRLVNGQLGLKMDDTDIGIIATFTQANNANYHSLGIKAFTNLVLSAPGIAVAFDSTTTTSLNWTSTVANDTLNFLTGANVSGGTLTLYAYQADIRHGMITEMRSRPNVTFSTASMSDLRLVASIDDADAIQSGESRGIRTIGSKDDLDDAAAASKMVWALTDDGTLGVPVYTGSEWTMGEPTEDEPSEPVSMEVVSPEYVDVRVERLQAEIETLASAMGISDIGQRE